MNLGILLLIIILLGGSNILEGVSVTGLLCIGVGAYLIFKDKK